MCTNRALVNSLECYLDELVESFEDFVKKSLIMISVGIGAVMVMLFYALSAFNERRGSNAIANTGQIRNGPQRSDSFSQSGSFNSIQQSRRSKKKNDFAMMKCCNDPKMSCKSIDNALPSSSAMNECLLKEIAYINCSENCDMKKRFSPHNQGSSLCHTAGQRPLPFPTLTRDLGPNGTNQRISIPSLPTNPSMQHATPPKICAKGNKTSCCSMCCTTEK